MKDIESFEAWWGEQQIFAGAEQFKDVAKKAWLARTAVEADRAQRVPDGFRMVSVEMLTRWRDAFAEELGAWDIDPPIHHVQVGFDETSAMLASTPAQPAQQEPDCPRCNGSGEDPEGYFDQSRGPDGGTYDGPCRDCAGTGAAPQPVERKPMTDEQWKKKLGDRQLFTIMEAIRFVEKQYGIRE